MQTRHALHTSRRGLGRWLLSGTAAALMTLAGGSALAADLPGKGVQVLPLKSSIAEEGFQTLLVMKALE